MWCPLVSAILWPLSRGRWRGFLWAYLGKYCCVSGDGGSTDPSKTEAVRAWPVPCWVTEVRIFLGLMFYYHHFIYEYVHIAKPLHKLTECGKDSLWMEACDKAFCSLKMNLASSPVLAYLTLDDMFILEHGLKWYGNQSCPFISSKWYWQSNWILQQSIEKGRKKLLYHSQNYYLLW